MFDSERNDGCVVCQSRFCKKQNIKVDFDSLTARSKEISFVAERRLHLFLPLLTLPCSAPVDS
jgi:hypothetical protein